MNHEALHDFADSAQAYCSFVDGIDQVPTAAVFRRLEYLLTDMLSKAVLLPTEEAGTKEDGDRHSISHDEWKVTANRIARALGDVPDRLADHLADVEDGNVGSDDSIRARYLWDDLADIDRDLRVGLSWWHEGSADSRSEACWQWRFGYESHWGYHAIRALYSVHQGMYLILGET